MSAIQLIKAVESLPGDVARTLRNTYLLLTLSLIPTIMGSFVGMAMMPLFMEHPVLAPILLFVIGIGTMFLVMANKNSGMGVFFLLIFTAVMGIGLGPTLSIYLRTPGGSGMVILAAAMTMGVFAAMSAITIITKKDFGFLRNVLFASLIVVIIASLAGIFIHASAFQLMVAAATAIIFTGYLLYDLSEIVQGRNINYISATLSLYLDLLNLFLSLLRILDALRR